MFQQGMLIFDCGVIRCRVVIVVVDVEPRCSTALQHGSTVEMWKTT